jgi:hypothetical protein
MAHGLKFDGLSPRGVALVEDDRLPSQMPGVLGRDEDRVVGDFVRTEKLTPGTAGRVATRRRLSSGTAFQPT